MLMDAKWKIGAVCGTSEANRLPFALDDCSHLPRLKTPSSGEPDIRSRKRVACETRKETGCVQFEN
jgi:hypothetical protein